MAEYARFCRAELRFFSLGDPSVRQEGPARLFPSETGVDFRGIHAIIEADIISVLRVLGGDEMRWKCPKCGREFSRQNQDHYCSRPQTIEEYIAAQPEAVQPRLREIRAVMP